MKADSSAAAHRWMNWMAALVVAPVLLAVVLISSYGWSWLRGPIERVALEKTGRVLRVNGDFSVGLADGLYRRHAGCPHLSWRP